MKMKKKKMMMIVKLMMNLLKMQEVMEYDKEVLKKEEEKIVKKMEIMILEKWMIEFQSLQGRDLFNVIQSGSEERYGGRIVYDELDVDDDYPLIIDFDFYSGTEILSFISYSQFGIGFNERQLTSDSNRANGGLSDDD
ncbi:MAG: hypothetical protein EZS28_055586 [Streblomastix strix]|uniref:Uncharacterized protein n=1 Tax=Streblomastix strix TaxID=222440 RepID=A0A5J4PXL8_9EUKA|nr:MAG: hypothetical protein EZS28_055586 [Streblomastix strix]